MTPAAEQSPCMQTYEYINSKTIRKLHRHAFAAVWHAFSTPCSVHHTFYFYFHSVFFSAVAKHVLLVTLPGTWLKISFNKRWNLIGIAWCTASPHSLRWANTYVAVDPLIKSDDCGLLNLPAPEVLQIFAIALPMFVLGLSHWNDSFITFIHFWFFVQSNLLCSMFHGLDLCPTFAVNVQFTYELTYRMSFYAI